MTLSWHLRSRDVTKGRIIKNFVKSQPLFDVHQQYVWTFLKDLQFLFCLFSQILVRLSSVSIFYKLSLVTDLHLEYIS